MLALKKYHASRILLSALLPLGIALAFTACSGKESPREGRVLARINDYELMVSDFKKETSTLMPNKGYYASPEKAREAYLEEMINKKILIQEAQKQNYDKEKFFMEEIEKYWEQALLKLLLKKKGEELTRNVMVSSEEVKEEYSRMKRRINAEIIVLNDEKTAKELSSSQEKFEEVRSLHKGSIISDKADWFYYGDLPWKLENTLYGLKPGGVSLPVKENEGFIVFRVIQEEAVPSEAFEKVAEELRNNIMKRKEEESIESWMAGLRKSARVTINKKALQQVDLK
jgi:peptidyl-prolyl cis-trans isomerase C